MDVTLLHYQSFHNNQKITKKKIFLSSPDQKAKRVDITWMQSIEERNQCFGNYGVSINLKLMQ
jgi:hypothetical protein